MAGDIRFIAKPPSLKAAQKWIGEKPAPDIYFTAIRLGDGISIELFGAFKISCPVVFVTAKARGHVTQLVF